MTTDTQPDGTRWRAAGPYVTKNASKAGLLAETRQFILAYAQFQDFARTRRALINGGLPQRSRATRETILNIIARRLIKWHPPDWVWQDLITFSQDEYSPSLPSALLLHVTRQDTLLYDLAQHFIWPRWHSSDHEIVRADVQRFLDEMTPDHPEIDKWSFETREHLVQAQLTIFRDYGLLRGKVRKQIAEPVIPPAVMHHLVHLLLAEGIAPGELAHHPDWRIWLWVPERVQAAVAEILPQVQDPAW